MTRKVAHEYTERKMNHFLKSKQSQWYREIKNIVGKIEKGADFNVDVKEYETANKLNATCLILFNQSLLYIPGILWVISLKLSGYVNWVLLITVL